MKASELMARIRSISRKQRLKPDSFEWSASSQGQDSIIATMQVETPHILRAGKSMRLHIPAYETRTTDGSGNAQTFSLTHPLQDAPANPEDLSLWANGAKVQPDSVDYDNDQFTYTDDGTAQDLEVFYLSNTQAELKVRLKAPKNVHNDPISRDAGTLNIRDQNLEPVTFEPRQPMEGLAPKNYEIQVFINAPYTVRYQSDSTDAYADNLMLSIPVFKSNKPINGLPRAKRQSVQ